MVGGNCYSVCCLSRSSSSSGSDLHENRYIIQIIHGVVLIIHGVVLIIHGVVLIIHGGVLIIHGVVLIIHGVVFGKERIKSVISFFIE